MDKNVLPIYEEKRFYIFMGKTFCELINGEKQMLLQIPTSVEYCV